jgi:hypothetical protein
VFFLKFTKNPTHKKINKIKIKLVYTHKDDRISINTAPIATILVPQCSLHQCASFDTTATQPLPLPTPPLTPKLTSLSQNPAKKSKKNQKNQKTAR